MQILQFSILINADKQKVWNTMLQDKTYREWTKEFYDGSYYEGGWEKGNEIRFLARDERGNLQGMFSRIKENIPFEFISIEHLGLINNGIVDTSSEEIKKWAPSFENYTFSNISGQTGLKIEMQVVPEFKSMFEELWPKALKALKSLCEE